MRLFLSSFGCLASRDLLPLPDPRRCLRLMLDRVSLPGNQNVSAARADVLALDVGKRYVVFQRETCAAVHEVGRRLRGRFRKEMRGIC